MADQTAVEGAHMNRRECWCCGTIPEQLVHLGNHPEESLVAAYRPPWGRHHSAHKGLPAHYAHRPLMPMRARTDVRDAAHRDQPR